MQDGINKKPSLKEKFFGFAAILGFIVDVTALLQLLSIRISLDGKLELASIATTDISIHLGSFQMTGKMFTGYVLLIVFIASLFTVAFHASRNVEYSRADYLLISYSYVGALNLLIFLWLFSFSQTKNLNLYFLISFGMSIPWLYVMSSHWLWRRGYLKGGSSPVTLPNVFLLILSLTFASMLEVGYFGTTPILGLLLSIIAIVLGFMLLAIESILFMYLYEFLARLK